MTGNPRNAMVCGTPYLQNEFGDPQFFFGRSLPILIFFSIILKNQKSLYVGSFSYFSHSIQIGSNWYMDTGVRDLEVTFFKANST